MSRRRAKREHDLIPPRPPWLDADKYRDLADLRRQL